MAVNRRENVYGVDINRDYKRFKTPERAAIATGWPESRGVRPVHQPPEDWEARATISTRSIPTGNRASPHRCWCVEPLIGVDPAE
jgi:hypothetical protein